MTSMKPKAARSPRERVNRSPEHRAMLQLLKIQRTQIEALRTLTGKLLWMERQMKCLRTEVGVLIQGPVPTLSPLDQHLRRADPR